VPDYETGLRNNEPVRLQRQKVAKKQSDSQFEDKSKELSKEIAVKSDHRTEVLQNSPAAAAPVSAALENTPEELAEQPALEAQRSLYVRDDLQGKSERTDKDTPTRELQLEEELVDETDLMADSPEVSNFYEVASPALVGETATSEMKAQVRTDSEAEQILQAIIKLKQSGNESWKSELESFKENYPDYPLPEELTD
jgi:hypothetical protein